MAAKTPVRLYSGGTGLRVALYTVPGVTTNDTVDVGSTGTNDFSKTYLILVVPLTNSALAVTTATNATNFTIATSSLTGEDCIVLIIGAST